MSYKLALACVFALSCNSAVAIPPEFASATTPEQLLAVGKSWMRDSTEQDMSELRRLLHARRSMIPNGVKFFDQIAREVHPWRRLSGQPADSCYDYKTDVTCIGSTDEECTPCEWSYGSCGAKQCSSYENESACCANSLNIWHGCYWVAGTDGGSYLNRARCVDQKCDAIANSMRLCESGSSLTTCPAVEAACGEVQGCTNTCGGCEASGMTCDCTGDFPTCQQSQTDSAAMTTALFSALTCPAMDCVMCMKTDVELNDANAADKMANKWNGDCQPRCDKIVHCKEEALCLVDNSGSGAAEAASCTATPFPSCASDITTFTTTQPPGAQQTCADTCARFDQECAASCGPAHSCAAAGDACPGGGTVLDATIGGCNCGDDDCPQSTNGLGASHKQACKNGGHTWTEIPCSSYMAMASLMPESALAPIQGICCGTPSTVTPSTVKISLTVQNVDYAQLNANTSMKQDFVNGVKTAVAAQAGTAITPAMVVVTLSAASVAVEATITPPAGTDATSVQTSLNNNKAALQSSVITEVKKVPGISTVMAAGASPDDIEVAAPTIEVVDGNSASMAVARNPMQWLASCLVAIVALGM